MSQAWDTRISVSGAVYVTDSLNNRVVQLAAGSSTQLHPERAKTRALHQLEAMGYHVTLDRAN
jgi:hypothetical protein